jgi:hypothetical protein
VAEKFVCPHWVTGQKCKPYFPGHWFGRLVLAGVGASIAIAAPAVNCLKTVTAAPPTGPILISVIAWGALIVAAWVGSIVMAMHYEHDLWGSFVSSVGTPTLLIALITLPQLSSAGATP